MSGILNIDSISPLFPNGRIAPVYPMNRPPSDPDVQGGVAVTRLGGRLRRIVEQSSMRQARMRAVQTEIEDGIYETPERIGGTVDRLLEVIA